MSTGTLDNKLVTILAPSEPAAEAYRVLRTNLQFMGLDKPLQAVAITSATPSEGKSLTCANLAAAFAQAGQRVLLVDADLRRPTQAKLFGLNRRAWGGLTTVLAGTQELAEAVQETPVPGLSLLASGPIPPNPAEMLGAQRMTDLLEKMKAQWDLVIVDTPPVLAVADASILAPRLDGVILVVRAGQVSYPQAKRAKEALDAVKARMLGTVVDGVQSQGRDGYYYYYYYGRS